MNISPTVPAVWLEEFKVHSFEAGPSGFATPQAICRFLQEAASNHAALLDVSFETMTKLKCMWVLSHLSLRMSAYPRWQDVVQIETWPVLKKSSIRGYRDFKLRNSEHEIIGRASTTWLLLSQESRRPVKIPQSILQFASVSGDAEVIKPIKENEFVGTAIATTEFLIRGSDIDLNMHVNNVCYLEWALETMPPLFRLRNLISELDVSFISEEKYGSTIISECFQSRDDDGAAYLHRIVDKESARALALLRIRWQGKENLEQDENV